MVLSANLQRCYMLIADQQREHYSADVVAVAVTCCCAVVVTAVVVIAAAEPEHEKDNDNPAAVTAIAKVKSTVHKDFSFNDVF